MNFHTQVSVDPVNAFKFLTIAAIGTATELGVDAPVSVALFNFVPRLRRRDVLTLRRLDLA